MSRRLLADTNGAGVGFTIAWVSETLYTSQTDSNDQCLVVLLNNVQT